MRGWQPGGGHDNHGQKRLSESIRGAITPVFFISDEGNARKLCEGLAIAGFSIAGSVTVGLDWCVTSYK